MPGITQREILNSWKEIATYLGRGVRTVQRWEHIGLPVRRPAGHSRSAVFALASEIDEWLKTRDRLSDNNTPLKEAMTEGRELRATSARLRAEYRDVLQELLAKLSHVPDPRQGRNE